jgi:hypothetical protein
MKNSYILLSSRGVTLAKINHSHRNTNSNCNSLLQNNKPSFNHIAAKMAKDKTRKTKNLRSRGITLAKMTQSHRNANWNWNSLLQSSKQSFNSVAAKMAKKKKSGKL